MRTANFTIVGILLLLGGVALALYGYYLEPTVGQAFSNIFDGEFTDKRNILMLSGIGLAVVGAGGLAAGAFGRGRPYPAA